jgi:hydrogenase maturation protein HypF
VGRLRSIKTRQRKPLALMARDLLIVKKYVVIDSVESDLLCSARRPILLLPKKKDIPGIAPGLKELGFMLPYTPLHYLLLAEIDLIVATSSNPKDSPIMKDEAEGVHKLCDYILTHNRPIQTRADDSVMKVAKGEPLFIRRARGYVPYPQRVPSQLEASTHILALGGELKDTISIYKNGYVVTSQFLGDLDEYQNLQYFEETIHHLTSLFEVKPESVVTDLHPDFHTTRYAQRMNLPHLQVQHHFAHVLAPMLEHNIPPGKTVLGVSLDGFGYGDDGTAWGGEFLITDYGGYQRFAHFKQLPLPGGDLAAKQPWRMALSYLQDAFGPNLPEIESLKSVGSAKIKGVLEMIKQKINSPLSSSCGRLFDAVSFMVGLAPLEVEYEAEAPMLLESSVDPSVHSAYDFSIQNSKPLELKPYRLSFSETIQSIIQDIGQGVSTAAMAAKFHNTLAEAIVAVADKAQQQKNIDTVVLVGGVFLNKFLLERVSLLLERQEFQVLRSVNYSPNDESISIGQIAFALNRMRKS